MAGRQSYLGEFEQVVLLAVVRLGAEAYGTSIRREIEARGGRHVSIGAAYATLDRLVDKGYLRARDAAGGADREGAARRYFEITRDGVAALERARALQTRMWDGVELRRRRKA
ncbi:MAG: helix-turn-helix transcriptional regulator [Vicinamibacterales bacterium]